MDIVHLKDVSSTTCISFLLKIPPPKRTRKSPKSPKIPPKLKYPGLELLSSGDRRCVHLLVPRSTLNIRVGSASRGSTAVRVTDYVTASQRFFGKGSKRTQRERSEKRRPIFADVKGKIPSQKNSLRDLEVKESKVRPKTMQSAGQRG